MGPSARAPLLATALLVLLALLILFLYPGQSRIPGIAQPQVHVKFPDWLAKTDELRERSKSAAALLLGDSITAAWDDGSQGEKSRKKYLDPIGLVPLGVPGEKIEHLMWRVVHGEVPAVNNETTKAGLISTAVRPHTVVVLIGTNNCRQDSPRDIAIALHTLFGVIRGRVPGVKLYWMPIFVRKDRLPAARCCEEVNRIMLAGKTPPWGLTPLEVQLAEFRVLDLRGVLEGHLSSDDLHITAAGYEAWGQALSDLLKEGK
jgi:lysophospholipase L1-like esterase